MKKLVIWLVVVAFGVTLFVPPASAISSDPNKGLPWMDNRVNQSGDEGGWNDPHANGKASNESFMNIKVWLFSLRFPYVITVYRCINKIDESTIIINEQADHTGSIRDRRTSSPG